MKILKCFYIFPLFIIMCLIVYFFYNYIHSEKERTYYFPPIGIYMKVYTPIFDKYGYVFFSKDSVCSFSENNDFIHIYKSETGSVDFIMSPFDNNKIYVVDRWNNADINQVNFDIRKINRDDTTFFEQKNIMAGFVNQRLKSQYFGIFIDGYLQSVFYVDYNVSEDPLMVNPILQGNGI